MFSDCKIRHTRPLKRADMTDVTYKCEHTSRLTFSKIISIESGPRLNDPLHTILTHLPG